MVMVHPAPPPAEPRRRSLFGLRRGKPASSATAAAEPSASQHGGMHMGSGAFAAAGSIPQIRAPQPKAQQHAHHHQQQQQQPAYRQTQYAYEQPRSQSPAPRQQRRSSESQPSTSGPSRSAQAASSQPFPGDAGLDEGEYSASASYESSLGSAGQKSSSATSREGHTRTRSHFSIPDVVVTAAEEDGQTQHFEHQVPDQKRRSFVFASTSASAQQSAYGEPPLSPTSPTSPTRKRIPRPKPLIRLDSDGNGGTIQKAAPDAASSPTSPTSPTSTSSGTAKRTRKSSFPVLFGRRGSDPESAGEASTNDSAFSLPASSSSRDDIYRTADSFAGPSSPPSSPRRTERAPAPALPALSPAPALAPRAPLTKKQVRAREKEEATLMKDLEKVDRMVRAHDRKAAKEAERASKRERKLREAAAVEKPLGSLQQESKTTKALRRMTIFSTGPKTVRRRPSSARRDGRPLSGHTAVAAEAHRQVQQAQAPPKDSDDSSRSAAWSSREWTDVKLAAPSAQMPSLVHPLDAAAAQQAQAPLARSGSVQRARARAEAEGVARQRNSLRRTGSQTRMSGGGPTKRRSFIAASQRSSRNEDEMLGWEEEVEADLQRVERNNAGDETPRPKETRQRDAQPQQQQQRAAPPPRADGRASPNVSYSRPFRTSSESERDARAVEVALPTHSSPPAAPSTPPLSSAAQMQARSQSSPPRPSGATATQARAPVVSKSSPPRPARAPRGAGANPPGFSFPPRQPPQQRADTLPLAATRPAHAASEPQSMVRSASDPRFV
jgi:hypothetical protein